MSGNEELANKTSGARRKGRSKVLSGNRFGGSSLDENNETAETAQDPNHEIHDGGDTIVFEGSDGGRGNVASTGKIRQRRRQKIDKKGTALNKQAIENNENCEKRNAQVRNIQARHAGVQQNIKNEDKIKPKFTLLKRDASSLLPPHLNHSDSATELKYLARQLGEIKKELKRKEHELNSLKFNHKILEQAKEAVSPKIELAKFKEELGKEKLSLEKELEFEQNLRISVQYDLTKSNESLFSEMSKLKDLECTLKAEKDEKEVIKTELYKLREQLNAERVVIESMQVDLTSATSMICFEREKNYELAKKLKVEAAANISTRMELQSARARLNRVINLEDELELERSENEQMKRDAGEYASIKMELQEVKARLRFDEELENMLELEKLKSRSADEKINELTKLLERTEMHRPTKYSAEDKDRRLEKLRKELRDTQEKLNVERRKTSRPSTEKMARLEKLSLKDWVDAVHDRSDAPAPIMPPAVETSLPGSSELTSLVHSETAPVHYDGVKKDDSDEALTDELAFIRSAYSPQEISIRGNTVTCIIQLPMDNESEILKISVILTIPQGYPASGVLGVDASIDGDSSCSPDARRCALNALPKLVETCNWEARADEGNEALLSVFTVAETWAKIDWFNIASECLSGSNNRTNTTCDIRDGTIEVCTALIYTHHIVDDKNIQMVKKASSKFTLGGFIKTGKPGLVLIEGAEADCESMLELLIHSKKKARESNKSSVGSSTFKLIAKNMRTEADTKSCMQLPRKMFQLESKNGMGELKNACDKLGLAQALTDICQR